MRPRGARKGTAYRSGKHTGEPAHGEPGRRPDGRRVAAIALPPAMGRALEHAVGREVVFGVRPQNLALRPGADTGPADLHGEVALVEHLGTETLVDVDVAGFSLQASMPPTGALAEGRPVGISPDFTRAHVFDAAGEGVLCHGADHP